MIVRGECVCTLRYEGKQCEQERCLNGGRRHKVNGQVRCHCPFGLSGDRCEKVTYCEPGKGKLVNGKCECSARWTGLFCQMRTCYNGIPTGGMDGFCLCDVGFTGPFCDVPLICENGGKVTQDNECACQPEYTGERCELCAVGHNLEGDRCIPEVLESSLVAQTGSLSSRPFAWPIVVIGCVAALAAVLLITVVTLAVRRWSSKPSRENSVRGQPDATDV
ncbi:EGF-like domain protein [Ancylostoma duodenale]|uniref:EGF-like domain protein n=1 Tax=Ancylostoma duodenale TaxID=51022 RepID=A0A0C2HDF6_9BILA|nr:EGF-like domain protein [Ancylostoma duodenale]